MSNLTTAFFGIEKADRNADGTMTVYGKATDDSIDIDQQICDGDWLDRAMPHWFKSGGNIREQHSNIAAGVATDYEAKSDGHYISALVVDPVSVKKVEAGVLKGFSIGIKNPRVTRDKSAANGRIVDGQIVEVSLVDRPANPNCQLVLAKSASGDDTVVQVEDLIEKEDKKQDYEGMLEGGERSEPADKDLYNRVKAEAKEKFDVYPSAVANSWVVNEYKKRGGKYKAKTKKSLQSEDTTQEEAQMTETVSVPKSVLGDLIKFDKVQFEAARDALANLVSIEAEAMKEGHNELSSIAHLLESIAHLHAWYEGEEAEGEVMEETIELSAIAEDEDKMCDKCEKSMKLCKCNKEADAETEKSATMDKCLECGCHAPEQTHGQVDVTTADMVAPDETPKSPEADDIVVELEDQELPEKDNSSDENSEDLNAIVEQVVESATKALKSEIASLVAAKEAAQEKAVGLETELAHAKSLAVAGGPKRTARLLGTASNDLLTKAATYKAKANAATDPDLAKGYKALADKYYAEATETLNK